MLAKSDTDIVFEAEIYENGRGILKDEYVQGIVAKQVNEKLKEYFEPLFEGCYIRSTVRYIETDFEEMSKVTLAEYMKQYDTEGDFSFWGVDIFVLEGKISDKTINAEYEVFSKLIQSKISDGNLPNLAIDLYFVNEEKMDWCKKHFSTNSKCYSSFYEEVEDCSNIGMGYPENIINKTYDEYKKLRLEINADE